MRPHAPSLLAALLLVGSIEPLNAQVPDWVNLILNAAQLPVATTAARREGVTGDEIRAVLDAMRRSGVPANEAAAIFDSVRVVRREHGPADNFGAFVQSQLAAGKRGRELAAAIRDEHARQGKGKAARGDSPGRGRDDDEAGRGRDDDEAGRGRAKGQQPPGGQKRSDQTPGNRGPGRPPNR